MRELAAYVVATLAALTSAACAGHVAPAAPGPATAPRVSWIVRSGEPAANGREICRSDRPEPCVLQASTEKRPMSVTVSLYLYDAGAETTYQGAFLSEFVATTKPIGFETKVDYTIEPGKRPTAFGVTGPVTASPGEYKLKMALLAKVPGRPDPHQLGDSVRCASCRTIVSKSLRLPSFWREAEDHQRARHCHCRSEQVGAARTLTFDDP